MTEEDRISHGQLAAEAITHAQGYARKLDIERFAADQGAALELAAGQGEALRQTIAYTGAGVVSALREVASAAHDISAAIRVGRVTDSYENLR